LETFLTMESFTIYGSFSNHSDFLLLLLHSHIVRAAGMEPAFWSQVSQDEHASVACCGHLPFLSKLASYVLTGDSSLAILSFSNSGERGFGFRG
jgi:hypothetical protein